MRVLLIAALAALPLAGCDNTSSVPRTYPPGEGFPAVLIAEDPETGCRYYVNGYTNGNTFAITPRYLRSGEPDCPGRRGGGAKE